MTVDIDGNVEVRDYNEVLGLIQEFKLGQITELEYLRSLEKYRMIRVSRGGTVTLNGVSEEEIKKDPKAQILILELKKINLVYEKADLQQQYVWHDQNLNEQIWKLDLEMAQIDPDYVPMRGHWNFRPKNRREKTP